MSAKSTTVRFFLGLGFTVAPERTAAAAARMFLTPRRPRSRVAPRLTGGIEGTRGTVRSGGADVAFWSFGQGPAVLLVHGWEGRSTQMVGLAEALVRVGYRAVIVDLPAHGMSSGETSNLVLSARALQDVAAVAGPFRGLIAHSFGGAASMLAHLEKPIADRIVALAPSAEPRLFVTRAAEFLGIREERRGQLYRQVEAQVGRTFEQVDLGRAAGRTSTPLLVLHDARDEEVPASHGRVLSAVSTRGQYEEVRDVGHRRILKDPGVIARAVEFITEIPRTDLDAAPVGEVLGSGLRWENRSGTA